MKGWKTTVAGIVAGIPIVWNAVAPYLQDNKPIQWQQLLTAAALALLGWHAQDTRAPHERTRKDDEPK